MNHEDIMRMAREAGGDDWGLFRDFMPEIERFAALVAAAERERAARMLESEQWLAAAALVRGKSA